MSCHLMSRHLIETITDLEQCAIGFTSLTEQIDTTNSGGRLNFHIFASLAEFERALVVERTQASQGVPRVTIPRS